MEEVNLKEKILKSLREQSDAAVEPEQDGRQDAIPVSTDFDTSSTVTNDDGADHPEIDNQPSTKDNYTGTGSGPAIEPSPTQ